MNRSDVIRMLEEYEREGTAFLDFSEMIALPEREFVISRRKIHDFGLSLQEYVESGIRKLSSCDCEDPFLTAVFINLYNALQDNWPFTLKDEIRYQLLLDRDLTDVREGINPRLMNVGSVIQRKDWNFLKVLILYGIIRPKETLTRFVQLTHSDLLYSFLDEMPQFYPDVGQIYHHRFTILHKLTLKTFNSVDADEKAKILRKYDVLKSLAFNDYVIERNPSDTVPKCLYYYFQAIPDPFVTVREIEDLIEIPEPSQLIIVRNSLRSFRISYRRLFPESDVLQPRSLKHLSRCAVREHLCKHGLLPNVVSRLMIPKEIKEYLLVVNPES